MTNDQPAPKPRFAAQIWWFILGLFLFGVLGFAAVFAGDATINNSALMVGLAVAMVLLTGGAAFWAMRSKKIALGSGLLVGYAIAAVASGGQCTYLAQSVDYGAISGALIYLYGFVLAIIVGMIASIISAFMSWRRGAQ
jgi:hypothetical protein